MKRGFAMLIHGACFFRFTVLPLFILAFWSRLWIGWWAIIPIVLVLLWAWVTPRMFNIPQSIDHWTSKAILGGRHWINRKENPIPIHHRTVPKILYIVIGAGMLFIMWGILEFDPWLALFGTVVVYLGKIWLLDRMVWLWYDMQSTSPEYRGWERLPKK